MGPFIELSAQMWTSHVRPACRTVHIPASLSTQTLLLLSWSDSLWAGVAKGCEDKLSLGQGVLNLHEHGALPDGVGEVS